jgi:prevent-host-death family protein
MWERVVSEVGIRELRDNLSRYLNQVRAGGELVVTDHGRAVARVVPIDEPRLLDQLVADGLVTPASQPTRTRPDHPIAASGPVSSLVAEQRR